LQARGMSAPSFSNGALRALQRYNWPGNVRELENLMERLTITHGGRRLLVGDLPKKFRFELVDDEPELSEREDQDVLLSSLLARPQANDVADDDDCQAASRVSLPQEGLDLKSYLQDLEQHYISQALEREQGVVTRAAQLLGLQRTTLAEKMKKLGLG
uniref:helix-turn-helix domain-containing protein n=1 Tax=Spongiibacter sp. TaxID=2024860 RepID=UPI003563E1D3